MEASADAAPGPGRPAVGTRSWLRIAGAAVLLVLMGVLSLVALRTTATPGRLTAASPAAGAVLAAPPRIVTLDFAGRPDPARTHVVVLGTDLRPVGDAAATVAGRRVSVATRPVASGDYLVAYHVTFANGQQATGRLTFTVAPAAGRPAEPPPAPGFATCGEQAALSAVTGGDTGGHAHGGGSTGVAVLFLDVAALLAAAALLRPVMLARRGSWVYRDQEPLKSASPH